MSNVNEDIGNDLIQAAKRGDINEVKRLISEGADVNAVDQNGNTPLHLAARGGKKEAVEALLDEGANVNAVDEYGRTPLHLAAISGKKEVVEALLEKDGIDVNATDQDGKTPLDLTTNKEIKALLKKAAEDPDAGSVDEPSTSSEGVQEGDAQTEEQPSSFFGSLFSILMKPFSLIASFFGGFFSWLFGSNEEKIDESTSQTDANVSPLKSNLLEEKTDKPQSNSSNGKKTDESTLGDNSFPALN